jgi:hypothetical protein
MDTDRIDGIAAAVARTEDRRGVLRLLGGAALAAVGAAALGKPAAQAQEGPEAAARRRKPRKNRTCRPGQRVATVVVPATGTTVSSPALRRGQPYRLRAAGFWSTNATRGVDAFADFALANPNDVVTVFQGVRLGLEVDGGSPQQWGSYTLDHVYEQRVVGSGRPITFRHADVVHADNAGTLTVDVICD